MLGLPEQITACLFDLDGVLTQTATVHAAAWKRMFDDFLRQRSEREGGQFVPFDIADDYGAYVDGRPREDGTRTFLASRGIHLPERGEESIASLSSTKNALVLDAIKAGGVQAFPGAIQYLDAVRAAGLRTAVVSASANCKDVLASAGIEHSLEVRIDGVVARERSLHGKPAPDTFLEAARLLEVEPANAAVFEDALAGVEAGRAGNFGFVVGVGTPQRAGALRQHGADVVVDDLAALL